MANEYPWLVANGRIGAVLEKICSAARPEKFTQDFLEKLGFPSSNDRAIIPLLRRLNFLSESNQPTSYYDLLRDSSQRPFVLAERIRDLYSDLFSINTNIYNASEADTKGAIARVTGKDEVSVDRYYKTFKALIQQANFDAEEDRPARKTTKAASREAVEDSVDETHESLTNKRINKPSFHYNIQIILPATTEIAVYNAIFKSLKDNLDL